MEVKRKVVPVEIDYLCPDCKEGYMRPTGIAYATSPMKYPHKCTHCGSERTFFKEYPYVEFEYEDEE